MLALPDNNVCRLSSTIGGQRLTMMFNKFSPTQPLLSVFPCTCPTKMNRELSASMIQKNDEYLANLSQQLPDVPMEELTLDPEVSL
ncbi:hypothetical protein C1H46_022552 [Malus baccata]|uniref:Uncharacterized protein n=1 Tax=Malus baccata TaxID=106549 RepID=A0A540M002_MALBA|nr:hypothetical protein C1H46_022552 [Malus baccata]